MSEDKFPSSLTMQIPSSDITESMIYDVAERMGVKISDLVVYCARTHAPHISKLEADLGCTVILVPNEIMKDNDTWAAHHKDRHEFGMWSPGA